MINKITNNKISITIGIPIDKNQFASVRPVTIYPIIVGILSLFKIMPEMTAIAKTQTITNKVSMEYPLLKNFLNYIQSHKKLQDIRSKIKFY